MACMNNREFAELEFRRQKRNEYVSVLIEEVRGLREENEMLRKQLEERSGENE